MADVNRAGAARRRGESDSEARWFRPMPHRLQPSDEIVAQLQHGDPRIRCSTARSNPRDVGLHGTASALIVSPPRGDGVAEVGGRSGDAGRPSWPLRLGPVRANLGSEPTRSSSRGEECSVRSPVDD